MLAGFLFIGGGAAIYLSTPAQTDPGLIGLGGTPSPGVSLPVFVQETPTPDSTPTPTATPFFTATPTPIVVVTPTPTFFIPTPSPTFDFPTPPPTDQPTDPPTVGPDARFGMTINGQTVSFQNKTIGSGLEFLWNFGNGTGSARATPRSITYKPGDYVVTLTVTDSSGRTSSRSHPLHIDAAPPPPSGTPRPTRTPRPTDNGTPRPTKSPTPTPGGPTPTPHPTPTDTPKPTPTDTPADPTPTPGPGG